MADPRIITGNKSSSLNIPTRKASSPKKPSQQSTDQLQEQKIFAKSKGNTLARDAIANKVSESSYVNSGIQGASSLMAREGIGAELTRKNYLSALSQLDPTDREKRTEIKFKTREATPPVIRSVIESKRKDLGPNKGSNNSANKSNVSANELARTLGRIGKGNAVVGVALGSARIASAENKTEEAARVSGGVIGGVATGSVVGAELGALGLNPYTVAGGAIVGGIVGGIGGEKAVDTVINWLKD